MNFPDLNHLLQLRKDLSHWPSSRAALMVGAGLSLNARPAPGTDTQFPTWRQLARAMFDELYPHSNDPTEQKDREERFNRNSPLRIAGEYEAAFSRGKLESFIRAHIPDSGHQPGAIHEGVLELLWRDVFTTNYDTLLERTEVTKQAYQPVTTTHELTTAFAPRIIKLHGSFPSQTPFIITDEDYRTYPRRFAPFVNTVRQSLIENSLVLLGFSGEDPNFLEWTGWIRDELGNRHAPIYLVGWLSLDSVQRSLLVKRGVTPIDLAPVFPRIGASREPHTSALLWFIDSLMATTPGAPERWPEPKSTARATTDTPPVSQDGPPEPEELDILRYPISRDPPDEATLIKVIERWRFERTQYPGWIVPTDQIRDSLRMSTEPQVSVLLDASKSLLIDHRVRLYREINWRLEVSMIPLFRELLEPFRSTIDDLLPLLKDHNSESIPPTSEVVEGWFEIAFSLLRDARESYDVKRWNALKKQIDQIVVEYPQFADRHHYEQALWLIWNIDRREARRVLQNWSPSAQSHLAVMWKAGLLAELDELPEARTLLRSVRRDLRRSLHNTTRQSIDLLSLEGWCTYLLFVVEQATDPTTRSELRQEFHGRWQELKTWDCNPWPLKKYFDDVLSAEPPAPTKQQQINLGFDPGHRIVTHSIGGSNITPWLPAFACIRLYERVGIPMLLRPLDITGSALRNACKWIAPFTGFWSPSLLIRAGRVNDLKKHHFVDRAQVATMELGLVKGLNRWAMDALKRELSALSDRIAMESAQASIVEVLVEVLSRLTLRLDRAELQEAFDLALQLHRQPGVCSHVRLNSVCSPWFERLFAVAEDTQLLAWLPELVRFPLFHELHQSMNSDSLPWPDPMTVLPTQRLTDANSACPEFDSELNRYIDSLLERTKIESRDVRHRSSRRLVHVLHTGLMTEEQRETMGVLLWKSVGNDGFPDLPGLGYSAYLNLPAPVEINVAAKTKEHLLNRTPSRSYSSTNGTSITRFSRDLMIHELALVSRPVVQLRGELQGIIEWSLSEIKELWEKTIAWWDNDKKALPTTETDNGFPTGHIVDSVRSLGVFLARAVLPNMDAESDERWNKAMTFLSEARSLGVYLTMVLPYVLLHRPDKRNGITQTILGDLTSDDKEAVVASTTAVRHWIYLAEANLVDDSPGQAVHALINRVVFRRREGVQACLAQLSRLLVEKPDVFDSEQVYLVVSSLEAWSQAIRLPIPDGMSGDFAEEERPELRARLGELAAALSIWSKKKFPDQPEPSAIARLRDSYESDPLPEVRRSFDTWKRVESIGSEPEQ